MELNQLNNELFSIEHLTQDTDVSTFIVSKGKGLEYYLKSTAKDDELDGVSRTYIIRRMDSNIIVAYFSLRTGLITVSRGLLSGFDTYTAIELANFAVNDKARIETNDVPKLGSYIFANFILPLVQHISSLVGAKYLYIYALPEVKLMSHYETMGFQRINAKMEKFFYRHVKPLYDKGCIFMLQEI